MGVSTVQVVNLLQSEGFSVTPGYVAWALRERHVPPPESRVGMAYVWQEADVQRLRSFLVRRGRMGIATGKGGAL